MTKSQLATLIRANVRRRYDVMTDEEILRNYERTLSAAISADIDPSLRREPSKTTIYAGVPPTPSAAVIRERGLEAIVAGDDDEMIAGFVNCMDCGEQPPAHILAELLPRARDEQHLLELLEVHPKLTIHQYTADSKQPPHRPEIKLFVESKK